MVGFKELLRRLQIQEQMTKQHQTRVDVSEKSLGTSGPVHAVLKRVVLCQGRRAQMSWTCKLSTG